MTQYQIIYWREIPVQVKVREQKMRRSRPLSARFQKTVHRAAYRGKVITGEPYTRAWHSSRWYDREESIEGLPTSVTAELETNYSDERLNQLALNKGYEANDD